jgi:hypothetical protein
MGHQQLVENLAATLSKINNFNILEGFAYYSNPQHSDTKSLEIDLIATHNFRLFIFEVKDFNEPWRRSLHLSQETQLNAHLNNLSQQPMQRILMDRFGAYRLSAFLYTGEFIIEFKPRIGLDHDGFVSLINFDADPQKYLIDKSN